MSESLPDQPSLPAGDYLGFDYGTVRIGMGIGNSLTGTARPLSVAANNSGTPDWQHIDRTVVQWQPAGLVVGVPLDLDGNAQDITRHAQGFLRRVKKRYDLPVFSADERFSSMQAQQELQKMRARGQRSKTQHADVDTLAAALILEYWFTTRTFTSEPQ